MTGSAALLESFLALHPKLIDLSLDRMVRLLDALGNPQNHCPPIIHLAGTNGKGSTLAMLRAMLEAANKRVHTYTSPHLVRFNERIVLAGEEIDEAALLTCLEACRDANAGAPITYFEITTAAAFLAFSQARADFLLLETGLGGRLDATNLAAPVLSIITPISLDHQDFLGDTLEAIAAEKAGILKPATPAIFAPQSQIARRVLDARAEALQIEVAAGGQDWQSRSELGRLIFEDGDGLLDLPTPALVGDHQIINAGTAIAAARKIGLATDAIAAGLTRVRWPARLARLPAGPLTAPLFAAGLTDIWLDGGHNEAAAYTLAQWLGTATKSNAPIQIILGLMRSKASDAFLAALARSDAQLQCHTIAIPDQENSYDAEALAATARTSGLDAASHDTLEAAVKACAAQHKMAAGTPPPRVLIAGSLYLAGAALRANAP